MTSAASAAATHTPLPGACSLVTEQPPDDAGAAEAGEASQRPDAVQAAPAEQSSEVEQVAEQAPAAQR